VIGIRTYVTLFGWAAVFVLQACLPMKTIAMMALAFCAGAAVHAVLIRAGMWLFSRKCVRIDRIGERGARRLYWLGIVAMGSWYLVAAIRDGRTPLNVVAIQAAYVTGVFLYERRDSVRDEVKRRLAVLFGKEPWESQPD
jgi:hypothetical protein